MNYFLLQNIRPLDLYPHGVNTYSTYWSATARTDGTTAYRLMFSIRLVQADSAAQRSFGSSVRCVRE